MHRVKTFLILINFSEKESDWNSEINLSTVLFEAFASTRGENEDTCAWSSLTTKCSHWGKARSFSAEFLLWGPNKLHSFVFLPHPPSPPSLQLPIETELKLQAAKRRLSSRETCHSSQLIYLLSSPLGNVATSINTLTQFGFSSMTGNSH